MVEKLEILIQKFKILIKNLEILIRESKILIGKLEILIREPKVLIRKSKILIGFASYFIYSVDWTVTLTSGVTGWKMGKFVCPANRTEFHIAVIGVSAFWVDGNSPSTKTEKL